MTYQVQFAGQKSVKKFARKTSAREVPSIVCEWSNTVEMSSRPSRGNMLAHFTSFLYSRFGITVHYLAHLPNRPGHYIVRQTEDSDGHLAENGAYLATYVIRVSYRIVEPLRPFEDTMGLPAARDEP